MAFTTLPKPIRKRIVLLTNPKQYLKNAIDLNIAWIIRFLAHAKPGLALHWACRNNDCDLIATHIGVNYDFNEMISIAGPDAAKMLIDYAHQNGIILNYGPAMYLGNIDCIKYGEKYGPIEYHVQDLASAVIRGHLTILEHFVNFAPIRPDMLFRYAVDGCHVDVMQFLAKRFNVLNTENNYYEIAAEKGRFEAFILLYELGFTLPRLIETGNFDILQFAQEHGVMTNADECLRLASKINDINTIDYLLNSGRINIELPHVATAVMYGHLDLLKYYISKGAIIKIDELFEIACYHCGLEMVQFLHSTYNATINKYHVRDIIEREKVEVFAYVSKYFKINNNIMDFICICDSVKLMGYVHITQERFEEMFATYRCPKILKRLLKSRCNDLTLTVEHIEKAIANGLRKNILAMAKYIGPIPGLMNILVKKSYNSDLFIAFHKGGKQILSKSTRNFLKRTTLTHEQRKMQYYLAHLC